MNDFGKNEKQTFVCGGKMTTLMYKSPSRCCFDLSAAGGQMGGWVDQCLAIQ